MGQLLLAIPTAIPTPAIVNAIFQGSTALAWAGAALKPAAMSVSGASAVGWQAAMLGAANLNIAGASNVIFLPPSSVVQANLTVAGSAAVAWSTLALKPAVLSVSGASAASFDTQTASLPVYLQDASYSSEGACGVGVNADGTVTATNDDGYTWLLSGSASDYQVRASGLTGNTPVGTFNTWLGLGPGRAWALIAAPQSCSFLLEIRDVATHTVQASASVSLEAT